MFSRPWAKKESQTSPRGDGARSGAPLSPAQGRRIVRRRLEQLAEHALLSGSDIPQLSRQLMARRYAAGEVILTEGVHGDCLGLVTNGQVAVYSSHSIRNSPILLLAPGSVFGEAMLTAGQPSGSTLCAITDAEIYFLRRADLLAAERAQPRSTNVTSHWRRWLAGTTLVLFALVALLLLAPVRRAVALVPYSAGLWLGQHGQDNWAETTWALAQHLTPDWAAPHLSLGNLHFRQGQIDQAQVELEQASILAPGLAEAYNSLGLLYAVRGDQPAALEAFRQALSLEPGQATVAGNLAFSLQLVDQPDEALRYYAVARSLHAPLPGPLTNEAIAHYETGNLTAAKATARQALDLDAKSAPAHTVLGAVELAQQRPWAARLALENAVRLDPTYGPAHFYLGLAYEALNLPSLAYIAFDRVVSLNHDVLARREAHRHLSELYTQHGANLDRNQPYPAGEGR